MNVINRKEMYLGMDNAISYWWQERKEKGAHHYIIRNLPFFFNTLNALYLEIRKLPLTNAMKGGPGLKIDEAYTFTYNLSLSPQEYGTLRLILSLSGDLYNLLAPLTRCEPLFELTEPIKRLYQLTNSFREVRNFFTHLDKVFTNMDKHGISGPIVSSCGITYSDSAKKCLYLIWLNNTIFFTWQNKEYKKTVDKPEFQPIFQSANELYRELTKGMGYPENLYPEF